MRSTPLDYGPDEYLAAMIDRMVTSSMKDTGIHPTKEDKIVTLVHMHQQRRDEALCGAWGLGECKLKPYSCSKNAESILERNRCNYVSVVHYVTVR